MQYRKDTAFSSNHRRQFASGYCLNKTQVIAIVTSRLDDAASDLAMLLI